MDLTDRNVAVTGATGFLGRHLVDALLERGAHVIGVVRNPEKGRDLADRGVELRRADLAHIDALTDAFRDVDALISNAALVSLGGATPEQVIETNVEGTRRVFDAVERAGVARVAKISSVAAYRAPMLWGAGDSVDEDTPLRTADQRVSRFTAYGLSKALSERLAWERAADIGVALTTFRPTTIFGSHDPNFMPTFRRFMRLPICPFPVGARISLVYAGDVADAVARALERPDSAGRAYNVGGDDTTLWSAVSIWRSLGQRVPALRIPLPLPLRIPWSSARAERELGWARRPLAEAFRETAERDALLLPT